MLQLLKVQPCQTTIPFLNLKSGQEFFLRNSKVQIELIVLYFAKYVAQKPKNFAYGAIELFFLNGKLFCPIQNNIFQPNGRSIRSSNIVLLFAIVLL